MANAGIKISKDGFDVKTTDDKNLAFSSKFSMFKVFMSGSGQLTLNGSDTLATVTITHNLGYRPAFFLFSDVSDVVSNQGVYRMPNRQSGAFYHIFGLSKTNTFEINVRNTPASGSSKTFNYKYFILVDKAE